MVDLAMLLCDCKLLVYEPLEIFLKIKMSFGDYRLTVSVHFLKGCEIRK